MTSTPPPRSPGGDTTEPVLDRLREWTPDVLIGGLVLAVGTFELWTRIPAYEVPRSSWMSVVLGFAVACALSRRVPSLALVLVWVTCGLQLLAGIPVITVEFSVVVVAFGCARWGHPVTVLMSGLSIPAGAAVGYAVGSQATLSSFKNLWAFGELLNSARRLGDTALAGAMILGFLILVVPWLAGLVLRATARARRSEVRTELAEAGAARAQHESQQAREIARLREEQATLARDVHDVVGHSLAVILAQAESGQYLPSDDPERLKTTMATIASTARASLQDVRQVLAGPAAPGPARRGSFEQLLDGVRASGHDVRATEVGTAQPLPPELDVVAHRVVQEMLTNAVKHGRRDRPVLVEHHWPEGGRERDLRIEVRNVEDLSSSVTEPLSVAEYRPGWDGAAASSRPTEPTGPTGPTEPTGLTGRGIDGMHRRLATVGGRLDVRRRTENGEPTFTATAWVPVSGR